jgi:hypothetical protein
LEIEEDQILGKILFYKQLIMSLFGVSAQLNNINFFSVTGKRLVFRKKKNTNFGVRFTGQIYNTNIFSKELVDLLFNLIFIREQAKIILDKYDLSVDLSVQDKTEINKLTVILVNPQYLLSFFQENRIPFLEDCVIKLVLRIKDDRLRILIKNFLLY